MKAIVYGSHVCPDTIFALNELVRNDADMEYRDISGSMKNLREFLGIRDQSPKFEEVKKNGGIGIPLFVFSDGTQTFDLKEALNKAK